MGKKIVFGLALFAAAIGPVLLILLGKSEAGWMTLISAIIVMLGTRFDAIEEISLGPLRAKLRKQVEEAEQVITAIRALATQVASTTLSLVKRSGRLGGYDDEEEEAIRIEVHDLLKQLGVGESEVNDTLNEWHRFTELDYSLFTLGGTQVPKDLPQEHQPRWKELRSGGVKKIPLPEELKEFFEQAGMLTSEREELIKDYEFYLKNRKHRRPDHWGKRREWSRR